MYTLGSVCGLIAPLAFGLLADSAGVAATMAAVALLVLLTLPFCLVLGPALHTVGSPRPAE